MCRAFFFCMPCIFCTFVLVAAGMRAASSPLHVCPAVSVWRCRLSVLFSQSGQVVNSSIDGCIQMKSYLSGERKRAATPLDLMLVLLSRYFLVCTVCHAFQRIRTRRDSAVWTALAGVIELVASSGVACQTCGIDAALACT